jgi:tetratricopeptide (TPR) repeat protein
MDIQRMKSRIPSWAFVFFAGLFLGLLVWHLRGGPAARRHMAAGDEDLRAGNGEGALAEYRKIPEPWRAGEEVRMREGTALLYAERWSEALRALEGLPEAEVVEAEVGVPEWVFRIRHNLALAYLGQGLSQTAPDGARRALQRAVAHARRALRLRPGSEGTARNLELALRALDSLDGRARPDGTVEARRLLESFRLQERGALEEVLMESMREELLPGAREGRRGPPW